MADNPTYLTFEEWSEDAFKRSVEGAEPGWVYHDCWDAAFAAGVAIGEKSVQRLTDAVVRFAPWVENDSETPDAEELRSAYRAMIRRGTQ